MRSLWTLLRHLRKRRAPRRKSGVAILRKRSRFSYCTAAMVLLALCLHPSPAAQPTLGPALAAVVQPPTNSVSAVYAALSRCAPNLAESERWRIAGAIHHESRRFGYDPLFVLAMVQVESGCRPTAQGPRGAVGLIQIKPSTARAMAEEAGVQWDGAEALKRPVFNVQMGLRYLARLERRFQDPYLAMAAYNMGPARVAGMPAQRARGVRYVQRILARYKDLAAAVPTA